MTHKLARYALEHATCGRRYANGAMHVIVTHHVHTWLVHIVCTMPH